MQFAELHERYGEVYLVDTRLTAECKRASNVRKSDENDARILLKITEDFLAGRLPSGVWPFVPNPLKRALRECERAFKAYQKVRAIWPEKAEELKREYRDKVREVERLAAEDGDCQELRRMLNGFGKAGTAVARAIAELRGKRFHSVKSLYQYARKNRRLREAISALTEMIWRNQRRSEKARKIVEELRRKSKKSLGGTY